MIGLAAQDAVGVRRHNGSFAGDFGEPPDVVVLVSRQVADGRVRLHRHGEEEPHAVHLSPFGGAHDAIVQPFRALRRRHR